MSVADMVANLGEKTEWKVLQAAEDLGAMVSIKDVGPEKAAEGRQLIANGDGIGAIVRTLATAGDKEDERQDLKLALTTALIRLSIGEDRELRAQIIDAGALPLLIKTMETREGELAQNLQHCAAGCLGCIARGDEESREAVFDSGAIQCLQSGLDFCQPLVQQECCTALANIMWGQVDAVEAARETGLINSLLESLKYANPEVMNEEKFSALQDAACGALLNMCIAKEGEGQRCVAELIGKDGKDVLSKFVHGSTNEPAARKAVQLLDKCGVKGVGTRGHFYDKMKSVVIGILLWRMLQSWYWATYPGGDGTFDLFFELGWDKDKSSSW